MTEDQIRRFTDNADVIMQVLEELIPRGTKKQQAKALFIRNVVFGIPNATLFPEDAPKKEKPTPFSESKVAEFEEFEKHFKSNGEQNIDLYYYYCAVRDWSTIMVSKKRTSDGWIATARTFMRKDAERNVLKTTGVIKPDKSDMLKFLEL